MSLPSLDTQGSLFESVQMAAGHLFEENDRYRLFAQKIYPLFVSTQKHLAQTYQQFAELREELADSEK